MIPIFKTLTISDLNLQLMLNFSISKAKRVFFILIETHPAAQVPLAIPFLAEHSDVV
jgi:hypothetical protein